MTTVLTILIHYRTLTLYQILDSNYKLTHYAKKRIKVYNLESKMGTPFQDFQVDFTKTLNNIVRKISLHYSSGKFEEQALRADISAAEQQLKEMEIEAVMLSKEEKS